MVNFDTINLAIKNKNTRVINHVIKQAITQKINLGNYYKDLCKLLDPIADAEIIILLKNKSTAPKNTIRARGFYAQFLKGVRIDLKFLIENYIILKFIIPLLRRF